MFDSNGYLTSKARHELNAIAELCTTLLKQCNGIVEIRAFAFAIVNEIGMVVNEFILDHMTQTTTKG